MHPNRQFPGHLVVHMPSCLHVLFFAAYPLHSNGGGEGEGAVIWGVFPRECGDTVAAGGYHLRAGGWGVGTVALAHNDPTTFGCMFQGCAM